MPLGSDDGCGNAGREAGEAAGDWTRADRIPSDEIIARLTTDGVAAGLGPLEPLERDEGPAGWGPAKYFRFKGALGTVGVISPLSHMFCADCNRLRLTADGQLRTCLFSDDELDARRILRHDTEPEVRALVAAAVAAKPESHNMQIGTVRWMSQVGG